MKLFIGLFLLISTCFHLQAGENNVPIETQFGSEKNLIVYLSRTQNTKAIAVIVQEQIGGTLVFLELKNPYPEDYVAIVRQVVEENESGFFPR